MLFDFFIFDKQNSRCHVNYSNPFVKPAYTYHDAIPTIFTIFNSKKSQAFSKLG